MRGRMLALAMTCVAGCGSSNNAFHGGGDSSGGGASGSGGAGGGSGGSSSGSSGSGGGQGDGGIAPGMLTAGAWDDNVNFDFYLGYLAKTESDIQFANVGLPIVPRADRMTIVVVDADGLPYSGAQVTVSAGGTTAFTTTSASDGRVLFFPTWAGVSGALTVSATAAGTSASVDATAGDHDVTVALGGIHGGPPGALDVTLVLDTTGSMGDELAYLDVELESITSAVAQAFPGIDQRWALVVYRDENSGDPYEVRQWDFTSDLAGFRNILSQQQAGGGGDTPEIPDRGLETAAQLGWRSGNVARLAFLVADAPHHPGRQQRYLNAVAALRSEGVRIYGVGASGVDEVAEYSFRAASELSGGRYLFLTDDSGIGNPHKEPTLPCYLVTRLNQAMVRMITMELTGTRIDPAAADVIRTGGDPMDGRCTLDGGVVVSAL
jgi:von Willebrand factor type A domain